MLDRVEHPQHVAEVDDDVARAGGVVAEVAGDVLPHAIEVEADEAPATDAMTVPLDAPPPGTDTEAEAEPEFEGPRRRERRERAERREAQARACGASMACFAAVIRPDDHPERPAGYQPLDAFWARRGYAPVPGFVTELAWQEHDVEGESVNRLQYWLRQW